MNKKLSTLVSTLMLSSAFSSASFAEEPICFSQESLNYINYIYQLHEHEVEPYNEINQIMRLPDYYYDNEDIIVSSANDYLILDFKPHIGTLSAILLDDESKTTIESKYGSNISDYRLDSKKKYALSELNGKQIGFDEIWVKGQPYMRFLLSKEELIEQLGNGHHNLLFIEYESLGGFRGYQKETEEMTYSATEETPIEKRLFVGFTIEDEKIISYQY